MLEKKQEKTFDWIKDGILNLGKSVAATSFYGLGMLEQMKQWEMWYFSDFPKHRGNCPQRSEEIE